MTAGEIASSLRLVSNFKMKNTYRRKSRDKFEEINRYLLRHITMKLWIHTMLENWKMKLFPRCNMVSKRNFRMCRSVRFQTWGCWMTSKEIFLLKFQEKTPSWLPEIIKFAKNPTPLRTKNFVIISTVSRLENLILHICEVFALMFGWSSGIPKKKKHCPWFESENRMILFFLEK